MAKYKNSDRRYYAVKVHNVIYTKTNQSLLSSETFEKNR